MPTKKLCNLFFEFDGQKSNAAGELELVSTGQAFIRSIQSFGATIFAGLATIVIPGVHFISVPLLVGISPLVGLSVFFKVRRKILRFEGSGLCPSCHSDVTVSSEEYPVFPVRFTCKSCKNLLYVLLENK